MALNILSILSLVAATILLGYLGDWVFKKTSIPDPIWLMMFGLLVGPVLQLIDTGLFVTAMPLLAVIALVIILFEGGLELKVNNLLKEFLPATKLSLVNLLTSIVVVTLLMILVFRFEPVPALLMGAIVSGTGSAVILSIINRIHVRDKIKTMVSLESIITDPITIVVVIAVIGLVVPINSGLPWAVIASGFSTAIITGFLFGVSWMYVMFKHNMANFKYMLTMAILLALYVITEILGGSGAIAVFSFGIGRGNSHLFNWLIKIREIHQFNKTLIEMHEEFSFFIRAFFFVNLGLIFSLKQEFIILGVLITLTILIGRYVSTKISLWKSDVNKEEQKLIWFMGSRGLAAAVMAQLPTTYGLANHEMYSTVAFIVIFLTILFTTVTLKFAYKPESAISAESALTA